MTLRLRLGRGDFESKNVRILSAKAWRSAHSYLFTKILISWYPRLADL